MADLGNVKVGDRVWLHTRWGGRRVNLHEVVAVTASGFRVKHHPKDLIRKRDGKEYKGSDYWYQSIATPEEIAAWDANQSKEESDRKEAEAQQAAAHQERCERARKLFQELKGPVGMSFGINKDVVEVEYMGHKFELREVKD